MINIELWSTVERFLIKTRCIHDIFMLHGYQRNTRSSISDLPVGLRLPCRTEMQLF